MTAATKVHVFEAGGRRFELAGPADPDSLLDHPDLEARFEADGYMPYWADLWPAARMLAARMLTEPPPTVGAELLEIGCGLGLAGIAAGTVGWSVTFSDYDADARRFAEHNASAHGLTDFRVIDLDFRRPPARRFPMVIASDVLYEERLRGPMVAFLAAALLPGGRALVADPDRRGVRDWLGDPGNLAGLSCAGTPAVAEHPGGPTAGTLWEFRRPAEP